MNDFIEKLGNLIENSDYHVRLFILIKALKAKMNEVAIRENISFDEAVKSARPFLDNKLSEIGMNQKLIEMALEGETDEIIRGQKIAYATKMFNDMFWRSFRVIKS